MDQIALPLVIAIFLVAAYATWMAGVTLAKATDTLDTRWKIGDALGGLVLLGVAGSLPEVAVVWSAAAHGRFDVIIGNLIGGLSIQTLVLVIFDIAVKGKRPLSYHAGSRLLQYETLFAIGITVLALVGTFLPHQLGVGPVSPASVFVGIAWFGGLFFINRARKDPTAVVPTEEKQPGRRHHERRAAENHPAYAGKPTLYVMGVFVLASAFTLMAGVLLEETGSQIAATLNIGSGLFAATAIALVTSLPEISTGLESIFIGDHHLAVSDIMGGNAFMLVIFILADLVAGQPVLSYALHSDKLLTVLAIVMMGVYVVSFVRPPQKRYLRMGWDSLWQIGLYAAGMVGLTYIK
jgi:cation:H+ antiporter